MTTGIHDAVADYIRSELELALITNIASDDDARAGIVILGPLQADPSQARISVGVFTNNPDAFYNSQTSAMMNKMSDRVVIIETGAVTWRRCFTIKARCLLARTKDGHDSARNIASTLRERIETALLGMSFAGIKSGDEYVSRTVLANSLQGEMVQAGGPPNSYDYHIKLMFDILTTRST